MRSTRHPAASSPTVPKAGAAWRQRAHIMMPRGGRKGWHRVRSFVMVWEEATNEEIVMGYGKALCGALVAGSMVAGLAVAPAGPALAKQQERGQQTTKAKKTQTANAKKDCITVAPPFMRNPRYMNRGFFRKKCKTR